MLNKKKIVVAKSPSAEADILLTGFFGGIRNGIISLIIYTDVLDVDQAVAVEPPDESQVILRREIKARVIMEPIQAIHLAAWLRGQVDVYEHMHGKIKLPEITERSMSGPKMTEKNVPQPKADEKKG